MGAGHVKQAPAPRIPLRKRSRGKMLSLQSTRCGFESRFLIFSVLSSHRKNGNNNNNNNSKNSKHFWRLYHVPGRVLSILGGMSLLICELL